MLGRHAQCSEVARYFPDGLAVQNATEISDWITKSLGLLHDGKPCIEEGLFELYASIFKKVEIFIRNDAQQDASQVRQFLLRSLTVLLATMKQEISRDVHYATRLCKQIVKLLDLVRLRFSEEYWVASEPSGNETAKLVDFAALFRDEKWFRDNLYRLGKFSDSFRRPVPTHQKKTEDLEKVFVSMTHAARFLQSVSLPALLVEEMKRDIFERSSTRVFTFLRLLTTAASNVYCHQMVKSGIFQEYWGTKPPGKSGLWESHWIAILARAVKYGWATGDPLIEIVHDSFPRILNMLSRQGPHVPHTRFKHVATIGGEKVAMDTSKLLRKQLSARRSIATLFVYTLVPRACEKSKTSSMQTLLKLLDVLAPYCLSSGVGHEKREAYIATFILDLTSVYLKRVGRERHMSCAVSAGRDRDGTSYRLGPVEDSILLDAVLPLCLGGLMKKGENIESNFQTSITQLCAVCPHKAVPAVMEEILPLLDNVSEPLSLVVAINMIGRLVRPILIYHPQALNKVLEVAESGIDISEPNKSRAVLGMLLALLLFLPDSDCVEADVERLPMATIHSQFLMPLWGFKTQKNRDAFNQFHQETKISSVLDYPEERLGDDNSFRPTAAVNAAEWEPARSHQDDAGYQTEQEVKNMLLQRQDLVRNLRDFKDSVMRQLLGWIEMMKQEGVVDDEQLNQTLRHLVCMLLQNCPIEEHRKKIRAFFEWICKDSRASTRKLVEALAAGLGESVASFDPIPTVLKVVQPVILTQNNTLNDQVSSELVTSLVGAVAKFVFACPKDTVARHVLAFSKLAWALLHADEWSLFKAGIRLSREIVENLLDVRPIPSGPPVTESSSPKNLQIDITFQTKTLVAFCSPRWLQLRDDFSGPTVCFPPLQWSVPAEDSYDLAMWIVCDVLLKYLEELEIQAKTKLYPNAKTSFNAKNFLADIRSTFKTDLSSRTGNFHAMAYELPFKLSKKSIHQSVRAEHFFRSYKILKTVAKALSVSFPEEVPRPEFSPVCSFTDRPVGNFILLHCWKFVEDYSNLFVGLEVDGERLTYKVQERSEKGVELDQAKVMTKLAKLSFQVVSRPSSRGTRDHEKMLELMDTFQKWAIPTIQIQKRGLLENLSQREFAERIEEFWLTRCEWRRGGFPFTGIRRQFVGFLLALSTYFYANVRVTAQGFVSDVVKRHMGARVEFSEACVTFFQDKTAEALACDRQLISRSPAPTLIAVHPNDDTVGTVPSPVPFNDEVLEPTLFASELPGADQESIQRTLSESQFSTSVQSADAAGDALKMQKNDRIVADAKDCVDNTQHDLKSLLHVQQSGLTYLFNNRGLMTRVMRNPFLKSSLCLALITRLSTPIEMPSLKVRLMTLARCIVDSRSYRSSHVDNDRLFLRKILTLLDQGVLHWRAQVVGVAILTAHLTTTVLENDKEVTDVCFQKLLAFADPRTSSPLLATASICGLGFLLKMLLTGEITISDPVAASLTSSKNIRRILSGLPAMYVLFTKTTRSVEPLYSVLVEVIKLNRSWPTTQKPKIWKDMSIHCCSIVQSTFQVVHRLRQSPGVLITLQEVVVPLTDEWGAHAPTDDDSHASVAFCLAGIFRAARKWEPDTIAQVFHVLNPIFRKEVALHNPDEINKWIEILNFAVHGILISPKLPHKHTPGTFNTHLFPNPIVFGQHIVTLASGNDGTTSPPMSLNPAGFISEANPASLSSGIQKMLRLLCGVYPNLAGICASHLPELREYLLNLESLSHESKKVRDTVSFAISLILTVSAELNLIWSSQALSTPMTIEIQQSATQYREAFGSLLAQNVDRLVRVCREYRESYYQRGPNSKAPPEVNVVGSLCRICSILNTSATMPPPPVINDTLLLRISFCARNQPDDELSRVGKWASDLLISRPGLCLQAAESGLCRSFLNDLWTSNELDQLEKNSVLQLVELYLMRHCLSEILYEERRKELSEILIKGLGDEQISTNTAAWTSFAAYVETVSQDERATLAQRFGQERTSKTNVMILSALVTACRNSIPYWLPTTITQFAQCANKGVSDHLRNIVEKGLQEFQANNRANWNAKHKFHFTHKQLEILEDCKGRPIYFA